MVQGESRSKPGTSPGDSYEKHLASSIVADGVWVSEGEGFITKETGGHRSQMVRTPREGETGR